MPSPTSSPTMNPPPPRTQPPPPVFSPPLATSYRSARKEELEALRQKGLAKIFNKHFTSVADKIILEREAAELALQEIVKRKAELAENPKSFKEGGLTLTQLDKLHAELKKRKSEVQRKERETQELYKRYCSQYGDNEHVLADVANWKNSTQFSALVDVNGSPVHNGHVTGIGDGTGTNAVNGCLDIIRQADVAQAKANDINGMNLHADVNKLAANIEDNAAAFNAKGETIFPTSNGWTPAPTGLSSPAASYTAPDAVAPSARVTPTKMNPITATTGGSNAKNNTGLLNTSALDTTVASTPTPSPHANESSSVHGNASVMDRSLYFANFEDDDDDSAVSGLTDIDCATVAEAEWKLTEFLRTETDNIKKMLSHAPNTIDENGEEVDNDDDNYSIFTYNRSLVSGESDRVGRAAREAEEMVARMAEATAWMNDPTLLDNDSDDSDCDDSDEEEEEEVLPEWVAFWSAEHEREYFHNRITNQTCWTKPHDVEINYSSVNASKNKEKQNKQRASDSSVTSNHADRSVNRGLISPTKSTITRIESPASDEKVAVRDFTKNKHTGPSLEAVSLSNSTSNHMINSFRGSGEEDSLSEMTDVKSPGCASVSSVGTARSTTKTSKVMQYRRKRARIAKRNRRVAFAVLFAVVFGIILFYNKDQWMPSSKAATDSVKDDKGADAAIAAKAAREADALKRLELAKKLAAAETERKRVTEAKQKKVQLADERRLAEERILLEEQTRQLAEVRTIAEEKERKLAEETKLEELEALKQAQELEEKNKTESEAERKRQETMQLAMMIEKEAMQMQTMKESLHRPWACNIPLTYLMSRKCWKVAKLNPIYDCKAITDSMMQ
jgi:hypothetical protein